MGRSVNQDFILTFGSKSPRQRVFYLGGCFYEVRIAVRCGEQRSKASGLH
jgi:hypothetical protein